MVTDAPAWPLVGLNPVIVGGDATTVKLLLVDTVTPELYTEIGPVAAPDGTVTTIDIELDEVTVAPTPELPPLNNTFGEVPK
jgi:hypothetical protein